MRTDVVRPGDVMRVRDVRVRPGGKGLHVALTCAALAEPVRLVGIIDRRHRAFFEDVLGEAGVQFCGVEVDDDIRTCLAVHDASGGATEFLEPGPRVGADVRTQLVALALERSAEGPVVLSGSLPRGLESGMYADIIRTLRAARVRCLLDASGEALRLGVEARPDVVSPNRQEAAELAGQEVTGVADAARLAHRLAGNGIGVVVVSLGADGAVAGDGERVGHVRAPVQVAANGVGAGDSLMGGLAVAHRRGLSFEDTMRFAVATAAAAVLDPEPGVVRAGDVERLQSAVHIDWMPDSHVGAADAPRPTR